MKNLSKLIDFLTKLLVLAIVFIAGYMLIPFIVYLISGFTFAILKAVVIAPEYGAIGFIIGICTVLFYVKLNTTALDN